MDRPLLAEHATTDAQHWRPGLTWALLWCYFALFGVIVGGHGVLWDPIVRTLRLSETEFGASQLAAPVLAMVFLLVGGQLSARGKKPLALMGLVVLAISQLLLGGVNGLWWLAGALAVGGIGNGLLETAMNGATLDWERRTGRTTMNVMHAGFSGGAVLGAFSAGVLLQQGMSFTFVLILIAGLCGLVFAATLPVRYPPVEAVAVKVKEDAQATALRRNALIVLAVLCALGAVGESVANLWAVIYLRSLGAEVFIGGAAFALFNGAMFTGRLLNAPLMDRLGARLSLYISAAGLVAGTGLLMLSSTVPLAVAGFVVIGLAVAGVIPTALSVAARMHAGASGVIAGRIMASAYAGFIIIPPVTGWVADTFSLKAALLSIGLSGLAIFWFSLNVDR